LGGQDGNHAGKQRRVKEGGKNHGSPGTRSGFRGVCGGFSTNAVEDQAESSEREKKGRLRIKRKKESRAFQRKQPKVTGPAEGKSKGQKETRGGEKGGGPEKRKKCIQSLWARGFPEKGEKGAILGKGKTSKD